MSGNCVIGLSLPIAVAQDYSSCLHTASTLLKNVFGDNPTMINLSSIDNLARRLSEKVPPGLKQTREELQASFKGVLHAGLSKMDVITREEFEVQRAILERTREKLEALEQTVAALEKEQAARAVSPPAST